MDPIEKNILEDFQKGNKEAFGLLMEKYGNAVYNMLARMISDREEAKDLTQETFLKAYRNRKNFHGDSSFYTWVYKIALNSARDYWRRKKETYPLSDADILRDESSQTEQLVMERLDHQMILQAIDGLEEEFREAVILRDVLGLSYQEIGNLTDVPEGTVKSRISRGRHRLREDLKMLHQKREG
ncbi:sigma-70 family RNA polymerase sigma factor [Alkalibacter rhizosphaerae]|uniref:Sigma-70 family RNA polymerase sigma factor n=1 Tax=Alkalibacter rhizosphaerae TaxID=2815577 RepID=A0A974XED2_9FIRM|nr:sigma-70 family RNA polymerase sigma factor [Alkalibacter rhizosphaerae]QSX08307.1 sigma-70 family RNA polymerase sigma factor [Alkalibacter rhizosphaerae]